MLESPSNTSLAVRPRRTGEIGKDWLEFKRPNLRHSTWSMDGLHITHHFGDVVGLKVNRITTAKVERFISTRQEQGMNLTTLRKITVTFNQVMKYAVRHKYIDHNPVRDAERPRGGGEEEENTIRILSPSETRSLLDADKDPKYSTLFTLASMAGLRQGELLGLKWSDIDWENSQIHVQRTFNKGRWYKPKSKTSNRKVDLGPVTMAALKRWRMACPPCELDLVFPNEAGKPINHGNMLRRHFYPALKKAGLPRMRFHDLRHTYASLLIEQRENIKYIQTQLGHSSPTVTLNIYSHLMNTVNQEAACRLERTVFETTGSKMVAENKKGANA